MKQLSISFILLLGFLALVPQSASAEIMTLLPVPDKQNNCFGSYSLDTKKIYIIDLENENLTTRVAPGIICQGSEDEYVFASLDSKRTTYAYNVTDVQSGSTLKYIPETKEMQVFPPTTESILKRYNEELKTKNTLMCLYKKNKIA